MEVTPGVHLVDGTWGGNVYLLLDDDGLALVDAALPGNAGKVLRYIRSLGRDPADLRYVVITHAHPDHTGTIPSLLRHASAKVAIIGRIQGETAPSTPGSSTPASSLRPPGIYPSCVRFTPIG